MNTNLTGGLFSLKFQALGTACEVKFRTASIEGAKEFRAAALEWIKEFERTWSRFQEESLICRINEAAGCRKIEVTPHGPYWVVGVEDAREEEAAAFRLAFSGKALATSGNGRRLRMIGGKKFGHIIDPRSGRPADNEVLTASCFGDDCLTAALLSTNAHLREIIDGLEEIECHHGVEATLQGSQSTHHSTNIHRHVLGF